MFCFILRFKSQNEIYFSGIPVLYIDYAAIWNFHNVIPNECANITKRLTNSKSKLEEEFLTTCYDLIRNFTVQFSFKSLTFTVRKKDKNVCLSRNKNEIYE